jgi:hypothetical protein
VVRVGPQLQRMDLRRVRAQRVVRSARQIEQPGRESRENRPSPVITAPKKPGTSPLRIVADCLCLRRVQANRASFATKPLQPNCLAAAASCAMPKNASKPAVCSAGRRNTAPRSSGKTPVAGAMCSIRLSCAASSALIPASAWPSTCATSACRHRRRGRACGSARGVTTGAITENALFQSRSAIASTSTMRTVLCCRQRQAPRPRRVLRVETGALS